MLSKLFKFFRKTKLIIHKHKWDETDRYSQKCLVKGCMCQRVLMERKFPKIDEPSVYWKVFDWSR